MERLLEIFNDLKNHSGRNDKEMILKKNEDNALFRDVLRFVYNPYIVTGISTKKIKKKVKSVDRNFETLMDMMVYLRSNNSGRDYDISIIQNFINKQPTEELREFVKEIATCSLKVGITSKTINKIYGANEIPEFNVMLAESYEKKEAKVKGDFYLTLKLDGLRGVAIKEKDEVKFFTRSGQVIEGLIELEEEFKAFPNNFVFDGELLLENENNLPSDELFRATQKVVRKDAEKRGVVFHIFDVLPVNEFMTGKSQKIYPERRADLESLFKYFLSVDENYVKHIKLLPVLYHGNDKNVISQLMDRVEKQKQEGLMLNTSDGFYEAKRVSSLLKIKTFYSSDGIVLEAYEGEGKYRGMLGGVLITYKDKAVKIGSGFSNEERKMYWQDRNKVIGRVAQYNYFEESKNQNGGYDLRFATWKGIRNDKDTSDVNYES